MQDGTGRALSLLDRGNLPKDTEGCVLLGEEYGHLGGKPAVLGSGRAYKEFMDDVLRNEPGFALSIEEAY